MKKNNGNVWGLLAIAIMSFNQAASARIFNCPIPPTGKISVAQALADPIMREKTPDGPNMAWSAQRPPYDPSYASWSETLTKAKADEVEITFANISSTRTICRYNISMFSEGSKIGGKELIVWLVYPKPKRSFEPLSTSICPVTAAGKGFDCPKF